MTRRRRPKLTVRPRWTFALARLGTGTEIAAMTRPPVGIAFSRDWWDGATIGQRLRVLRHEMAHWRQYERMGLARFHWEYFRLAMRHDYSDHPMEMEAEEAE
jgi:hypothetical protein